MFDLLGDQPCFSVKFLLHLSILFRPRCESGYGGGGGYCTHVQYVYSTIPLTKHFFHKCILNTHILDLYLSFLPQKTLCNEVHNSDNDDRMSGSNVLQLSCFLPLLLLVYLSSHFHSHLNTK